MYTEQVKYDAETGTSSMAAAAELSRIHDSF